MQINSHAAARLKKRDKCKLVFKRRENGKGPNLNNLILNTMSKKQFEVNASDYIEYKNTMLIYEGMKSVIIGYKEELL